MIESKLKAKNANSGQLFRPDWVSSAECVPHRIEQLAWRQLSIKCSLVMAIREGSNSKARPLTKPCENSENVQHIGSEKIKDNVAAEGDEKEIMGCSYILSPVSRSLFCGRLFLCDCLWAVFLVSEKQISWLRQQACQNSWLSCYGLKRDSIMIIHD